MAGRKAGDDCGKKEKTKWAACATALFTLLFVAGSMALGVYAAPQPVPEGSHSLLRAGSAAVQMRAAEYSEALAPAQLTEGGNVENDSKYWNQKGFGSPGNLEGKLTLPAPVKIKKDSFGKKDTLLLGKQKLPAGSRCKVSFSWEGDSGLWICLQNSSGEEKEYFIKNGKAGYIKIQEAGTYKLTVENRTVEPVEKLQGTLRFTTKAAKASEREILDGGAYTGSVVYQNVTIYKKVAEDEFSHIHDVKSNYTSKKIVGAETYMVAFDAEGRPLKLKWYPGEKASYSYLYDWDSNRIVSGKTGDFVPGGWTLDIMGDDANAKKVAYVLYCDQKIFFGDGSAWENPDIKKWLKKYSGKKTEIEELEHYYPYVQKIE